MRKLIMIMIGMIAVCNVVCSLLLLVDYSNYSDIVIAGYLIMIILGSVLLKHALYEYKTLGYSYLDGVS